MSKWVYVFDYPHPHPRAIWHCFPLEQIVLNLRWDAVQVTLSHPPSPPPGLISRVAVDDSFTPHSPTQRPSSVFLAVPFIFFSCTVTLSSETAWKGQIFTSVTSVSNPPRLRLGSHRWCRALSSHPQNSAQPNAASCFLSRRRVTGEYSRMGFISLDFKKACKVWKSFILRSVEIPNNFNVNHVGCIKR